VTQSVITDCSDVLDWARTGKESAEKVGVQKRGGNENGGSPRKYLRFWKERVKSHGWMDATKGPAGCRAGIGNKRRFFVEAIQGDEGKKAP